ncbi:carboxylesterase family protein (plasmid) [Variovorax sp. WS11]|nr:carboxylesterase family protein [Variovorax sp. WS11]
MLIEVENGKLRGQRANGAFSFRGIPYAADTGGANRFRAPQPVANWHVIRHVDADQARQVPKFRIRDCRIVIVRNGVVAVSHRAGGRPRNAELSFDEIGRRALPFDGTGHDA